MQNSGIILFGKHPAWSDHMYLTSATVDGGRLKRIFYDHSVIPALQGTEDSALLPENWSSIVYIDARLYCIVSIPSRDSIGRSRFPLLAAYQLPSHVCLEELEVPLAALREQMRGLLKHVLTEPEVDDSDAWCASVSELAGSFCPDIAWGGADLGDASRVISGVNLSSLMSQLLDENYCWDLKSCSFAESCIILEAVVRQYRQPVPVLLVTDELGSGGALLLCIDAEQGFDLRRYFKGNLRPFHSDITRQAKQVTRLLGAPGVQQSEWRIEELPSLRLLVEGQSSEILGLPRRYVVIAAIVALIGAVMIGLMVGGTDSPSTETGAGEGEGANYSFPAREAWIKHATDYVDWVVPLTKYLEENSDRFAAYDELTSAFKLELNPFSVVNNGEVRMDLVGNPTDRIFRSGNVDQLNVIYANIDEVRRVLTTCFEQNPIPGQLSRLDELGYQKPNRLFVNIADEQANAPEFDSNLPRRIASFFDDTALMAQIILATETIDATFVTPADGISPAHAELVRKAWSQILLDANELDAFRRESEGFQAMLRSAQVDGAAIFFKSLDVKRLSADPQWLALTTVQPTVESVQAVVGLLDSYRMVEAKQFIRLTEKLSSAVVAARIHYDKLKADFPDIEVEPASALASLETVSSIIDEILEMRQIKLDFIQATSKTDQLLKQIGALEQSFKDQYYRLADPNAWLDSFELELSVFNNEQLRSLMRQWAGTIRSSVLNSDIRSDSVRSYGVFREQTQQLLQAARTIDVGTLSERSALFSAYLAQAGAKTVLDAYLSYQISQLSSKPGNVSGLNVEFSEILMSVEGHLAQLAEQAVDIEEKYSSMNTDQCTLEQLEAGLRQYVENPLYLSDAFAARLSLLVDASLGKVVTFASYEDIFWYLEFATASQQLSGAIFTQMTTDFEQLAATHDAPVALGNAIRIAFSRYSKNLLPTAPEELFRKYATLNAFLPTSVQDQQSQELQEIAQYWVREASDQERSVPSAVELEALGADAGRLLVASFFTQLVQVLDEADEYAGEAGLQRMQRNSKAIESVQYSESKSSIEITFMGMAGTLVFLPVSTASGVIFVQTGELSLSQYLALASACGVDLDLYSFDNYWPRSFEPQAQGGGVRIWGTWKFRDETIFDALAAFAKEAVPAHINEPKEVLEMAERCGFRLLHPQEVEAVMGASRRGSAAPIHFSNQEITQLKESRSLEDSVYFSAILRHNFSFSGVDFERRTPSSVELCGLVGGSSELAYHPQERKFYAFGGSWLYSPADPKELYPLEKANEIYSDLGVRFVFDAPAPTYRELVERTAIGVFSEALNQ